VSPFLLPLYFSTPIMATRAAAAVAAAAARRASPLLRAGVAPIATRATMAAEAPRAWAATRTLGATPTAAAKAAPPPPRDAAAADGAGNKSMFTSGTVRVADVLALKGEVFYSTTADALVYDAIVEMVKHNIGSLVVVEPAEGGAGGLKPVGILTERDYLDKYVVRLLLVACLALFPRAVTVAWLYVPFRIQHELQTDVRTPFCLVRCPLIVMLPYGSGAPCVAQSCDSWALQPDDQGVGHYEREEARGRRRRHDARGLHGPDGRQPGAPHPRVGGKRAAQGPNQYW